MFHYVSIVVGPNMLKKQNADPYDTSDFQYVYATIQMMIDRYDILFEVIIYIFNDSEGKCNML
jgi:hypothetical protein